MAEDKVLGEWEGGGPQPVRVKFTERPINGVVKFVEIAGRGTSRDGLSPGPEFALLIPIEQFQELIVSMV